jgi:acyl carrier protein
MIDHIRQKIIFLIVRTLIAKKLKICQSAVLLSSELRKDLDMDSLEMFELTIAIKELFNFNFIDEDEMVRFQNVNDIVRYIFHEQVNIVSLIWRWISS